LNLYLEYYLVRRYVDPFPFEEAKTRFALLRKRKSKDANGKLRWDTARERKATWLYDNWDLEKGDAAPLVNQQQSMAAMPPARLASPRPAPHSSPRQIRPDLLKNIVTRKDPS